MKRKEFENYLYQARDLALMLDDHQLEELIVALVEIKIIRDKSREAPQWQREC